jgi:hypothetical protein
VPIQKLATAICSSGGSKGRCILLSRRRREKISKAVATEQNTSRTVAFAQVPKFKASDDVRMMNIHDRGGAFCRGNSGARSCTDRPKSSWHPMRFGLNVAV